MSVHTGRFDPLLHSVRSARAAQLEGTFVGTAVQTKVLSRCGIGLRADLLAAASLPPEMQRAAATTLSRWDDVKDDSALTLTDALDRLAHP